MGLAEDGRGVYTSGAHAAFAAAVDGIKKTATGAAGPRADTHYRGARTEKINALAHNGHRLLAAGASRHLLSSHST